MEPFLLEKNEIFVIKEWMDECPELIAGFTSKNGGCSKEPFSSLNAGLHVNDSTDSVRANRNKIADILQFPAKKWVGAEQTHHTHIEKVTFASAGRGSLDYEESFKGTDGFFTRDQGLLLTLCYADCVPLFFLHKETGSIGIAHAGWKGTVHGIAREMVSLFQKEGIPEKDIKTVIGPAICGNCYQVDDRVIEFVKGWTKDENDKPYRQIEDHQYLLDLKQLNKDILIKAGVLEENIQVTKWCTSCDSQYFFSHRRDNGKTGRMMSFIGWKEDLKK